MSLFSLVLVDFETETKKLNQLNANFIGLPLLMTV